MRKWNHHFDKLKAMKKNPKTVIIGLDGVPFGMIKDFAETGVMPQTDKLISQGIFRAMHSSVPEVSSVAWSSMITGSNPGQHGIFGFMDLSAGSYKMKFPNFNDLKAPPFWDLWDGQSVIINIPSTYPVKAMNGVLISGFVSIDFEKSVHPKFLVPDLKRLDYRLDVDSQKAHSSMELFLDDLDKTLDARIEAYRYLWDSSNWRTFMLVFTATDRLMHFLWDAYQNADHKYHNLFLEHFRKIDGVIGEIAGKISNEDLLIIHSDHGFERLDHDVYINYLLMQEGLLRFKDTQNIVLDNIDYGTEAFALDPARIYLNRKGKYPCGTVDRTDTAEILEKLEKLFSSLTIDGRKVIRDIYRKEQLYAGPYVENAPDLVLVGAEGFNLKANIKAEKLYDKGIFGGKHTQDTAFLTIRGLSNTDIVPDIPAISDITSIVEKSRALS
ncbi:MAG: alkaline phosphatase family protein [Planctomycetota bacterium]|jgi:predicted AlkP superfamily phosphohydrolase/phosphomutase